MQTFFDCKSFTTRYDPPRKDPRLLIKFYGVAVNATAAASAFEKVYNQINEWARSRKGVNSKNSYCLGAAVELQKTAEGEKLAEEVQAKKMDDEALARRIKQEEVERDAQLGRLEPLPQPQDDQPSSPPVNSLTNCGVGDAIIDANMAAIRDSFQKTFQKGSSVCDPDIQLPASPRYGDNAVDWSDDDESSQHGDHVAETTQDFDFDFGRFGKGKGRANEFNETSAGPKGNHDEEIPDDEDGNDDDEEEEEEEDQNCVEPNYIAEEDEDEAVVDEIHEDIEGHAEQTSGGDPSHVSSSDQNQLISDLIAGLAPSWASHSQLVLYRDTSAQIAVDYGKAREWKLLAGRKRKIENIDRTAYKGAREDGKNTDVHRKRIKTEPAWGDEQTAVEEEPSEDDGPTVTDEPLEDENQTVIKQEPLGDDDQTVIKQEPSEDDDQTVIKQEI